MIKQVLFISSVTAYPIIARILTSEGFRVDVAFDSEAGLQRLDRQPYDMVIVRENPGADNWQLCEKIRDLTDVPLIVINYNASTETCVRAIDAGADFFIRKPLGAFELLARVHCLLQRISPYQPLPVGLYIR